MRGNTGTLDVLMNFFKVHAQDQKYLRDQQDSAVAERKDQLLNSAAAARPSEMR